MRHPIVSALVALLLLASCDDYQPGGPQYDVPLLAGRYDGEWTETLSDESGITTLTFRLRPILTEHNGIVRDSVHGSIRGELHVQVAHASQTGSTRARLLGFTLLEVSGTYDFDRRYASFQTTGASPPTYDFDLTFEGDGAIEELDGRVSGHFRHLYGTPQDGPVDVQLNHIVTLRRQSEL